MASLLARAACAADAVRCDMAMLACPGNQLHSCAQPCLTPGEACRCRRMAVLMCTCDPSCSCGSNRKPLPLKAPSLPLLFRLSRDDLGGRQAQGHAGALVGGGHQGRAGQGAKGIRRRGPVRVSRRLLLGAGVGATRAGIRLRDG